MTKLEKAKEYVAEKVKIDGSNEWRDGDLIDAWLAGCDTAQKEFFDDILEHNKDVLERLKNNVPPPTDTKVEQMLCWLRANITKYIGLYHEHIKDATGEVISARPCVNMQLYEDIKREFNV